jgi:hypothetical protein
MRLILEYSEEQGAFHNNRHDREQNTNGYETVGFIGEVNSYKFVDYFRKEYGYDKHSIDFVIEKFTYWTGNKPAKEIKGIKIMDYSCFQFKGEDVIMIKEVMLLDEFGSFVTYVPIEQAYHLLSKYPVVFKSHSGVKKNKPL